MSGSFKILFAAELLHDYFANGSCNLFRFKPSAGTVQLMYNCNMMYKVVDNRLLVLVKTGDDNKPLTAPAATDRFTFFLELVQPVFMNISAPDTGDGEIKRFYFSNLTNNKISIGGEDTLFLTEKIKNYDAGATFQKGEMVIHNNITFECVVAAAAAESPVTNPEKWVQRLKNTAGSKTVPPYDSSTRYKKDNLVSEEEIIYRCLKDETQAHQPSRSPEFWLPVANNQFATGNDLLQIVPARFVFNLTKQNASKEISIRVKALNTATGQFDKPVYTDIQTYEKEIQDVTVDLSVLNEGKYLLQVNTTSAWVYVSNEAAYNNYHGVIEIFNHLPEGDSFGLYKTGGIVKDEKVQGKNVWLNYSIRFANRLAFFRYIVPKKGVAGIDADPAAGAFAPVDDLPGSFQSKQRLPIQEKNPGFFLRLIKPITSENKFRAPNPDITAPSVLTKDNNDYYCNIYLNY